MNEEKRALRKRFKVLRDGLSPQERAAWSQSICQRISAFCVSRQIHRMGVFHPLGSEVDLLPLVKAHPDWLFFFPKVSSTHPPRLVWGTEPLEAGPWGLQEPVLAQHFVPPVDLLLVPGLAFDEAGFRLGYGGGFYDALLAHLPDTLLTVAAGFECQRTSGLPVDPLDQPVHALLTEHGLTWFHKPEG